MTWCVASTVCWGSKAAAVLVLGSAPRTGRALQPSPPVAHCQQSCHGMGSGQPAGITGPGGAEWVPTSAGAVQSGHCSCWPHCWQDCAWRAEDAVVKLTGTWWAERDQVFLIYK